MVYQPQPPPPMRAAVSVFTRPVFREVIVGDDVGADEELVEVREHLEYESQLHS